MNNMRLNYEISGGNIIVVLRVDRTVEHAWNKPEAAIRDMLYERLKKLYLGNRDDRHITDKTGRQNPDDPLHRQYHLYRGSLDELPEIISYCTNIGIPIQEGMEGIDKKLRNLVTIIKELSADL